MRHPPAAAAAEPLWASEDDIISPRRRRRWLVGGAAAAIVCAGGLTLLVTSRARPHDVVGPAARVVAPAVPDRAQNTVGGAVPGARAPGNAAMVIPSPPPAAPDATAIGHEPLSPALAADATPVPEPTTESQIAAALPTVHVQQLDTDAARLLGVSVAGPIVEPPTAPEAPPPGLLPGEALPVADPAPTLAAQTVAADRDVRRLLSRYEAAYSSLDAEAATAVYPALDRRALSRAFGALDAQRVLLERCDVQVEAGSAKATCSGRASWRPKVGGGSMEQARRWSFDLRQVGGAWQIGSVRVQ